MRLRDVLGTSIIAVTSAASVPAFSRSNSAPVWVDLHAPAPAGYRYDDIFFVGERTGWLVGFGRVAQTSDGGSTWKIQRFPGRWQRSVGFVSRKKGWIGTLDSRRVLYETQDGGTSWTDITQRIRGAMPAGICGIAVVNAHTVYAVGRFDGPSVFVKTADGGRTWVSTAMTQHATTLVDVYFWSADSGIVVGGVGRGHDRRAVVLGTDDGGQHWSQRFVSTDTGEWGWKIAFPSARTGYVSVESGVRAKVLKTIDGGRTWAEIPIPEAKRIQGVGFITDSLGFVSGFRATWTTVDGGATWGHLEEPSDINRFRRVNGLLGFAAGRQAYSIRPDSAIR